MTDESGNMRTGPVVGVPPAAELISKWERREMLDRFAGEALPALIGKYHASIHNPEGQADRRAWLASEAYQLALAMVAERDRIHGGQS